MRGLEHLHPKAREKAEKLQELCKKEGLPLLITDTFRTVAEQDALYAQGRTKPGSIVTNAKGSSYQSAHMWGVAFDFCRNVKGKEWVDTDGFYGKVGALGKSIGLCWGGDWKSFQDKPHFELDEFAVNHSTKTLREKYGTPDKFKATWGIEAAVVNNTTPEAGVSTAKAAVKKWLEKGDKGDDVKTMQKLLIAHGYSIAADGSFGPKTDEVVRAFQKAKGLVVDGRVGNATMTALESSPKKEGTLPKTVRRGDKGEDVKTLQQKLGGLAVDGSFGPKTEAAVKAYQAAHGLAVDGVCGPMTWGRLLG